MHGQSRVMTTKKVVVDGSAGAPAALHCVAETPRLLTSTLDTAPGTAAAAALHHSEPAPGLVCAAAGLRWSTPALRAARRFLLLRRAGRFFKARCPYYANGTATLQSCRLRLLTSGDIELNPGPAVASASSLRVCCQNVCSLNNKFGTLRSHAIELATCDVIGLTETWLGPQVADSELQLGFSDYVWFRRDRDGRGGGVACAVRSNLSPVHRPDLQPDCEALVVQLGAVRHVFLVVSNLVKTDGVRLSTGDHTTEVGEVETEHRG
ncbi:hypothetical protein FJT64_001029 [Amphibalanus amphitrite]|uniref:Uncharacterized protein n=1 Tax=Amphibalanus amphitrite TaxID=1232801 RepID=A0A6A4VF17_AMPAM|nr:hypothetical protein FJT64_001029 [Amphibalanus amphitrite]